MCMFLIESKTMLFSKTFFGEKNETVIVKDIKGLTMALRLDNFRVTHCNGQQNSLLLITFRPKN